MVFSTINIVAHQPFDKNPEKKILYMEQMEMSEKKLFKDAINEYGIGNDGFRRENVTIFIFT